MKIQVYFWKKPYMGHQIIIFFIQHGRYNRSFGRKEVNSLYQKVILEGINNSLNSNAPYKVDGILGYLKRQYTYTKSQVGHFFFGSYLNFFFIMILYTATSGFGSELTSGLRLFNLIEIIPHRPLNHKYVLSFQTRLKNGFLTQKMF